MRRRARRRGFTLVELLIVVAIIGLLAGILLPNLAAALESARRATCKANIRGIFQSIKTYSMDERGNRWPSVFSRPNDPNASGETWGGNWDEDTFLLNEPGCDRENPADEDLDLEDVAGQFRNNLSCLWLLVREGKTEPGVFICPSDPYNAIEAESPEDKTYWSFESLQNCSYSFQNQLGRTTTDSVDPAVVVMADRSPGNPLRPDSEYPPGEDEAADWFTWNSPNHGWEGQNCVFGDGHVEFTKSPTVGYSGNNIWIQEEWVPEDKEWEVGEAGDDYGTSTGAKIVNRNDSWLVP